MNREKSGVVAVVAVATVGALVFAFCRPAAIEVVYPAERAACLFSRKIAVRAVGLWRGAESRAENVRLRREVASLSMALGECERLEAENARLRAALDYVKRAPGRWIAASVLSEDGGAAGAAHTLRLDKGSLAGVKKGAAVAVPDGLVGRIVGVTPHTSEVRFITDPKLKVSCTIEGSQGAMGVLSGGSDSMLALGLVTVGAELVPRSRVVTSGRGGVFPGGIEVGTIIDGSPARNAVAREVPVLPSVDFSTLEDVFIRNEK